MVRNCEKGKDKYYTKLCTSENDIESILTPWDQLWLNSNKSNPFNHHSFCLTWYSTIGKECQIKPFIIAMFKKDSLEALAPLCLNIKDRIITSMGGKEFADYHDILIRNKNNLSKILIEIAAKIEHRKHDYKIILYRIRENQLDELVGLYGKWKHQKTNSHRYLIDLRTAKNIDNLIKITGGSKYSLDTHRCRRHLKDLTSYELRWYNEADTAFSEIGEFIINTKRRQYQRTGAPDLTKKPNYNKFIRSLLNETYKYSAGFAVALYGSNGDPIAAQIGFKTGTTLIWYLPAYSINYRSYSPGRILILETLYMAKKKGYEMMDLTWGDDPYKRKWSTKIDQLYRLDLELN